MSSSSSSGGADCQGLEKDIIMLETRLENLCISLPSTHNAASCASIQKDIRTALRNIGDGITKEKLQNGIVSQTSEPSRIYGILKEPLLRFQNQPSSGVDADASSILSYLKLLAEMCPVVQSQEGSPNKRSPNKSSKDTRDEFWMNIIEPVCKDILEFLNLLFKRCLSSLSSNGSTDSSQNQGVGYVFHQQLGILLKGIRILLVYLKRAAANLGGVPCEERRLDRSINEVLRVLFELMDPKENYNSSEFDIGLDIRCNIGVAICYSLFYLRHPHKKDLAKFFKSIFDSSQITRANPVEPDIETEILSLTAPDVNRIAMAFGILNTWMEQEHDRELYLSIGKNILEIQHGVKEAVNLGSARILEIWTEKLSRPCVPSEILRHVSSLFGRLEFFCFMYMPGHIDAVKNCCRNALSALSRIYGRMDEEGFHPELDRKDETWISRLLKTILEKPLHITWIALSCVVKNTKKSLLVVQLDPNLPEGLLCAQRTFKGAANDTFIALMSYHFETCSEAEWDKTWIEPLFRTQVCQDNESNWPQKRSIIATILSSEKVRLEHIQVMVLPLLKSVVRRMNSGQDIKRNIADDGLNIAEASLLAAETIKMAYEQKIKIDPKEINLDPTTSSEVSDDSFRGLVPRSVLHNWLWSENPQIRLAGFGLLVETKKTSEIISAHDFESLKIFMKYNLASQNPAFRQQFMAYFKKLMKRLKDGASFSRRKKDANALKQYEDFLPWLWKFLAEDEGLFCGANFGRRCQALECLSELTLNFTSFEAFGINRDSDNTKYFHWFTDTYENNKIQALEVLVRLPIKEFDDEEFCNNFFNTSLSMCKSVKPPDSVTGRYLMTLLLRKCALPNTACRSYTSWRILESLYQTLQQIHDKIENTSLTQVSSESPLYGCVRCIRMIFQNTDDYKQSNDRSKYREFAGKLLTLCFKIDNKLFPVLGSAAPEGFLPGLEDSAEDKQVVRSLTAQMLLVCAWRTMKEICLLMSDMCTLFVMEGENVAPGLHAGNMSSDFILSFEQVSGIGDHLLYLLKNLMHRGVFEQVYVGFKLIANRLWKSSNLELSRLPEKWLQEAMDQEQISAKSITRRSAGLPFIFQALLSAENDNETFLHKWLERLFIFDESPDLSPIRIHSMNVLRGLFRDTSFSAAMMPFVPHGLKMAFRGLKSHDWTERNSGLMLYGAVIRRSFGAKLNLMNAPTFFRKFPQMYDFLLEELDICIRRMNEKNQQDHLQHNYSIPLTCDFTFHLLLLLSLFTASGRVEDTHFKLAEFIPRIKKCGASDDMEVRKLSAKALVPFLVSPEDKLNLATAILDEIRTETATSLNERHGLLLQFLSIVKTFPLEDSGTTKKQYSRLFNDFITYLAASTIMKSIKAPAVYETIVEILVSFYETKCVDTSIIYNGLEQVESSFQKHFGNIPQRSSVPGLPVVEKCIAHAMVKIGATTLDSAVLLEKIYNYFNNSSEASVYVNEFLEIYQEEENMASLFTDNLSIEAGVILDTIIRNYLDRVATVFTKFLGNPNELEYLKFLSKVPTDAFEKCYQDYEDLVKNFIERLFQVCDEQYSTTLQIKAIASVVLGKLAFSTSVSIQEASETKLCNMILQWSGSGMDDDMRYAVAESFPLIPFPNLMKFSKLNQAKIWGCIFVLVQDDENYLRQIMTRKLCGTGSPCCDRKALETLTKIFFTEFLVANPIEGLLVLIGLLMREDFEVEAKAADDETEDRLFDKSEMNMYFEHLTLAKAITSELICSSLDIKSYAGTILTEDQIDFYLVISNTNSDLFKTSNSSGFSILRLIIELTNMLSDCDLHSSNGKDILTKVTVNGNNLVKVRIQEILGDILRMLDKN